MFDWNDEDLANIIWGEPGDSDDHIVPYPEERENNSRKKEWNQEISAIRTTDQQKAAEAKSDINGKSLECSSNFGTSDAVSASRFGMDSWPVLSGSNASKTDRDSMGAEVSRSLDEMSKYDSSRCKGTKVENDLEIFQNPSDSKEHGELVDYGWANIGSFDDLDRIFSNDDPLFGNVSLDNADELWCSSKDVTNSPPKALSTSVDSPKLGLSTMQDHPEIKKEYVQQDEDSFSLGYGKPKDSASRGLHNVPSSMNHLGYAGGKSKPMLRVQTSFDAEGTSTAGQFSLGPETVASPVEYADKQHLKQIRKTQMANSQDIQALNVALSGLGVDEKAIISVLGKSNHDERKLLRNGSPNLFGEDVRGFERWNEHHVKVLKREFMRFKNAVVLWAMHPWERDARLMKEAMNKGPESYGTIVEIACTRSSDELLGARKAYHSLFDHSIEEDVASHIHGSERKLLVALVSAYRYEGPKVKDDHAKSEAKALMLAIKNADEKSLIEDHEIIRILSTRSKHHLKLVNKLYKEISGKTIDEDLEAESLLKETVQCLCAPQKYFCKVLDAAMKSGAPKKTQKGLTRVLTTQTDVQMKEIKQEYQNKFGVSLAEKIEATTKGSYKDFLLTIVARAE